MFARKLVSIEGLERLDQGASRGIGPSDAVKVFKLIVNPFDGLFDSFFPLVLAFFVYIPQFSGLPLG